MDDKEYILELIKNLDSRIDDVVDDVKVVKDDVKGLQLNDVEVRVKLSNIETSQDEIKVMINESTKENQKMTANLLEMIKENTNAQIRMQSENNSTDNKLKLSDRKEIWTIIGLIVGGVLAYFGLK